MRRTLIRSYLALTVLLLLALEIPLIYSSAMNEFHHLNTARQTEATRFAADAVSILRGGDGAELERRLQDYDQRLDVTVVLVNTRGEVVLGSRPGGAVTNDRWRAQLSRALAGERPNSLDYSFNVTADPLFVVQPVQAGDTTLGAVATISPTTALRTTMVGRLAIFAAVDLLGLLAAIAIAVPFTRWILRPVRAVDDAARAIVEGNLDARVPADSGPSEIRGLSRSVNAMADRLVTLLRAQRAFVADASHQLRNPLTALRLRVETLEPMVSDDGKAHLRAAVAQAERLSRIFDELLVLARAEGASTPTEAIDIRAVTCLRATAWQPLADEHNVHIVVDGAELRAVAAPGTVEQVLDVLLDNAVDMSPPGGRVAVRILDCGSEVELHVIDDGPGMSEQDRGRAFDRFWRGPGSNGREGSGLGLTVAQALAMVNAGRIRLEPADPHGLDAVLILPAAASPLPRAETSA